MSDKIIGIATHAHWAVDFDVSFNHKKMVASWRAKHNMILLGYKGLLAAEAREIICDQAVKEKCTHIFFLDADHIIPELTLDYLLETSDQAIVSGLVCRRFHPFGQVAWMKDPKTGGYGSIELDLTGDIYEVGVCAFGCTLINMQKLQELEKPWFRDTCVKKLDGKLANMRSDINLCDMFTANGEHVYIDTRVLVGHLGTNVIVYPQNAHWLNNIAFAYEDSVKLKKGQEGNYVTIPRML